MITLKDLVGSWKLVRSFGLVDGRMVNPIPLGPSPRGWIHYLDDGRMSVLIAHDGRKPLSGDRRSAPETELAAAARSFDAYAGTFTIAGDVITHHLDISSYENDRDTDYVRMAKLDGDTLLLETPPVAKPEGNTSAVLEWKRHARR